MDPPPPTAGDDVRGGLTDYLGDQKSLRGPAFKLLEEAQIFCQRHLPLPGKIIPGELRRQDKPLIPLLALREILVNALIHRDYSISDDVQVLVFDNRIEIISPGRLPGYVSLENILDARYSRNSKVVRNLARYPNPPNKDVSCWTRSISFSRMRELIRC